MICVQEQSIKNTALILHRREGTVRQQLNRGKSFLLSFVERRDYVLRKTIMTPFEQALLDATLEEFSDIPDREEEVDVSFSRVFIVKAEKLIRNSQRKAWQYVNTGMKRAVLVSIIAVLLASTALAVPAIREAIIKFFLQNEQTHYEFSFDPEQAAKAPECIETVYLPTYIPDGYQEDSKVITAPSVIVIWHNSETDSWIDYEQMKIPDEPENTDWYGLNAENVKEERLNFNGYNVLSVYDTEISTYIWTDDSYFYNLTCSNTVSQAQMQKIFYSIEVDEDAVIVGLE